MIEKISLVDSIVKESSVRILLKGRFFVYLFFILILSNSFLKGEIPESLYTQTNKIENLKITQNEIEQISDEDSAKGKIILKFNPLPIFDPTSQLFQFALEKRIKKGKSERVRSIQFEAGVIFGSFTDNFRNPKGFTARFEYRLYPKPNKDALGFYLAPHISTYYSTYGREKRISFYAPGNVWYEKLIEYKLEYTSLVGCLKLGYQFKLDSRTTLDIYAGAGFAMVGISNNLPTNATTSGQGGFETDETYYQLRDQTSGIFLAGRSGFMIGYRF